jgi:adenylate kinase
MIMGSLIALSGTPGTGKSIIGQLLAKDLHIQCLELNQIVIDHELHLGEDTDRETLIADVEKVKEHLVKILADNENRFVVVGHFADEVPKELLEVLIILRCNPVVLTQRLQEKGWSVEKILENVQAELLGECTAQALARHNQNQIFEIDTSELTPPEAVVAINNILAGKGSHHNVGQISWLRSLNAHLVHQIMEEKTLPS